MSTQTLPSAPPLSLSELAPRVLQSEIRSMTMECDRIGGVNLAQGVCDTPVPAAVAEGAHKAIRDGYNIYTRLDGIARLRNAIAARLRADRGLNVDPDREILVTSGATGAFHAAALALLNPGDEVILFEPFYGYHANTLAAIRVKPVIVPLAAPDWALDLDALRAGITPRTRALLINTPANPSGKIFTRNELTALGEIATEHNLFLFTDEIYEYFLYGNAEHLSTAMLPSLRERTILMSGYSKTFSITGWRIGYLVADPKWLGAISYFHDLLYVCAPAPFQHGTAAGLEQLGPDFYRQLALDHENKRDRLVAALQGAGLTPSIPPGAYYILADVSRLGGDNAAQKARNLLARAGVAAVAGSAFFRPGGGENLLRFCFAKQDADLDEACRRLKNLE
ncbi:MAG TPA: aminotransferase class I/II-fold pyridoxal phosphate-dependent enzyme [Terriglobia bacterium]|nr:aminotransferase class I/II-fold pyridoxal phosphate-dependent enzyme [Terriglobia bacterium]